MKLLACILTWLCSAIPVQDVRRRVRRLTQLEANQKAMEKELNMLRSQMSELQDEM